MATAYITHPDCKEHNPSRHHPESPARLAAISDRLISAGLFDLLHHYEAPEVAQSDLLRVHSLAHVERICSVDTTKELVWLDGDTVMGPGSLKAALRAAGAGVLATELVLSGEVERAFCAVRPPGHHAESDQAMGFCLFNNIAVAAASALTRAEVERVAILDFDVHHGNGTEAIFRDEPGVLFCSSFQHPFYPHSDLVTDRPNCVHAPLAAGSDGRVFREVIEAHWRPALEAFEPQIIFISAGFDGHWEEELAELQLTEADYRWATELACLIADRYADGRVVSMLEGGYALDALGRCVAEHIRVLLG
ncbi:MAG: histone deacetylase family protein [Gammaproteobacteria bacterium]|nr:histone deacetylase family protein [Gammaproteobacteria bacterium]